MTNEHVHSQHESKLLSVPAEIRRAIYAEIFHGQTHAFLSQGRIHVSVCLQPNLGDDCHDGRERRTTADWRREDPTWARRLRSSWGPHWECEEAAYPEKADLHQHRRHHAYDLVSVCKKMFLDVCDFVVKTTAINVTDLDTLNIWLLKPNELSSGSNCAWNFWDYIRPSIRKLNVALRLPLAFYGALEEDEDMISVASHHTSAVSMRCAMWKRLWPAICQLPQLRSLLIWLDHDDRPSWSFVNERLALRGVVAALTASAQSRSEDGTMPHIDITFNLPKLHPRFARPDTHFQESPPPPFTIERRIRQRFHCEEGAGGNLKATYKADFPVLHDIPDYIKENARFFQGDGMMSQEEVEMTSEEEVDMTLEDIEQFETRLWNEGTDPYSIIIGFSDFEDEDTTYMLSLRFPDRVLTTG